MQLKIICFDLWKTLVGEPSSIAEIFEIFREENKKLSLEEFVELDKKILMTQDIGLLEGLRTIGEKMGINNEKAIKEAYNLWRYSCDNVYIFADVLPTLNGLKDEGYILALITNTTRYGWEAVTKKYNLPHLLDIVVLSFKVGLTKPNRKVFEYLEKETRAEKSQIMMVGDSLKSDIEPTQRRGWQTQLIRRPNDSLDFLKSLPGISR